MRVFKFVGRVITENSPPYIIAEVGVNHGCSLKKAKEMISLAKKGGADAVKFQTYKAETLACKKSPYYWDIRKEPTKSQFELFKKYDAFGKKEYVELYRFARANKIDFLSTPFDEEAVDILAPLVPFFKIASADINNIPLLRKVARKKKAVVLSTGASYLKEIEIAVKELEKNGAASIALLHCILNYPLDYKDANLNMIGDLMRIYPDRIIGYSDHCLPDDSMTVLTTAYLKGARIIEKHFTYNKRLTGNDHYHAMDTDDLSNFRRQSRLIMVMEGSLDKKPLVKEMIARKNARRSIVTKREISKGELLNGDNLACKRPGTGINPLFIDRVTGRRARRDIQGDYSLQWKDLCDK